MSIGPWERGHAKFGIKHMPCKARQSPPFMILAEAKRKTTTTTTTTKYEFKHLIVGTLGFVLGLIIFQGVSPRDSLSKITGL